MVQLQPRDLERAFTAIGGKKNPVHAAGSLLGFSGDELEKGVPTWAWVLLALGVGVYAGTKIKGKFF